MKEALFCKNCYMLTQISSDSKNNNNNNKTKKTCNQNLLQFSFLNKNSFIIKGIYYFYGVAQVLGKLLLIIGLNGCLPIKENS